MRFWLEGKLQPGVMAKDVILHCIGEIGFDGATYRAMQFDGPGAHALTMDDRMTIANMAIEAGGKNGIFDRRRKDVRLRGRAHQGATARSPTTSRSSSIEDQKFVYDKTFDLSKLEPTVALPSRSGPAQAGEGTGQHHSWTAPTSAPAPAARPAISSRSPRSCKGRSVKIDTFGVPATPEVVHELQTTKMGRPDGLAASSKTPACR